MDLILNLVVHTSSNFTPKRENIIINYLFIYIHQACINVYNQNFKNLLYYQPETTKRVVPCFSRL